MTNHCMIIIFTTSAIRLYIGLHFNFFFTYCNITVNLLRSIMQSILTRSEDQRDVEGNRSDALGLVFYSYVGRCVTSVKIDITRRRWEGAQSPSSTCRTLEVVCSMAYRLNFEWVSINRPSHLLVDNLNYNFNLPSRLAGLLSTLPQSMYWHNIYVVHWRSVSSRRISIKIHVYSQGRQMKFCLINNNSIISTFRWIPTHTSTIKVNIRCQSKKTW